ncbi:nuclear transport factor 2 family protein [Algibacter sp. AS12]|uniref:nuclear transport factor 2 family protein n=1 Tax=Algibacter sp. AS12 TaxID=3135773 RepID=UPI00398B2BE2
MKTEKRNNGTNTVKKVIVDLIQTATNYDVETLDTIYHNDLNVIMIDTDDNLNTANKEAFKGLFKSKRDAGDPPMNTWAKFHKIDVNGKNAHVLLSRKNNLSGQEQILILSIDLVFEDGRWQVTREVIFLRPEEN